jgi:hypothetical protein
MLFDELRFAPVIDNEEEGRKGMSLWSVLGMVIVAGAIGGLITSIINDKGLVLPYTVDKGDGTKTLSLGFIGNILTGAVAAGVSWLLYGPISQMTIPTDGGTATTVVATLGSAVLIGMSGSGWLANAAGKNLLRATAVQAATAPSSPEAAQKIATASPLEAFNIAKQMDGGSKSERAVEPTAPEAPQE